MGGRTEQLKVGKVYDERKEQELKIYNRIHLFSIISIDGMVRLY